MYKLHGKLAQLYLLQTPSCSVSHPAEYSCAQKNMCCIQSRQAVPSCWSRVPRTLEAAECQDSEQVFACGCTLPPNCGPCDLVRQIYWQVYTFFSHFRCFRCGVFQSRRVIRWVDGVRWCGAGLASCLYSRDDSQLWPRPSLLLNTMSRFGMRSNVPPSAIVCFRIRKKTLSTSSYLPHGLGLHYYEWHAVFGASVYTRASPSTFCA